jgi:6-phosphogluconolactonase/glucosamine-6-phosphate isomerase/deaminase
VAKSICGHLNAGDKVLWLIAGGSNVPIAVEIMRAVRRLVEPSKLGLLTVSQTDERFGQTGHPDSNWQQMIDAAFDFSIIRILPILRNKELGETVQEWSAEISQAFDDNQVIIGQFGMGADGHIAGILPGSAILRDSGAAGSFADPKFTRVSLTPRMLRRIHEAYAFVYGQAKHKAVVDLHDEDLSLEIEPAQILKDIKTVMFFTDCL